MLTRAGVAKRLGKSIATVRRLEGNGLNPKLDQNGVHRFDPREVERIAHGKATSLAGTSAGVARIAERVDAFEIADLREQLQESEARADRLAAQLASARREIALVHDRAEQSNEENRKALGKLAAENQGLYQQLSEVLTLMEELGH